MERAEAGERITVTKRGRPTVQLTAIAAQHTLDVGPRPQPSASASD
jgi:antitoxin (DNA-binding transcriptional repressor) of toxin-antitoxin stability system